MAIEFFFALVAKELLKSGVKVYMFLEIGAL
jgi:hypothetical protein